MTTPTVEIDPNLQAKPWVPLKLPEWAEKIAKDVTVELKFNPPIGPTEMQKIRMELIWLDKRCRNPCHWTRWTGSGKQLGYHEGDGLYWHKGRLTYPQQSLAEARRKAGIRYHR